MRRRRQKNTLLPKMLGLAVLINAILLPILAQFGVFKSFGGGQHLTPVELVKLPPPERRPATPKKAQKKAAARPHPAGRKSAARVASVRHVSSGPPPVKVVAAPSSPASGTGNGGDNGIAASDSGPAAPVTPPGPDAGTKASAPVTVTPPVTPPPPEVPTAPPSPHVPLLVAAVPISQPHPVLPDEMRDRELDESFEGLFTIRPDGTAQVKVVSGTGNSTLDQLALDAAQRWTFHPATRDGQPVLSYLRLKVEFEVGA